MDEKEKANLRKEIAIRRMALFIIILCFGYLFVSSFYLIPIAGKDYSTPIVGILMLLIGFYWGSSSGSIAKGDSIDKMLNGKTLPVTTQTGTFRSTETIDKTTEVKIPVEEPKSEVKP